MANALDQIDHIILLMMENRSFDNMLGALYPLTYVSNGYQFDGLPLDSVNYVPPLVPGTKPTTQTAYPVWTEDPAVTDWTTMINPATDPGEAFDQMNEQIFGTVFNSNPPFGPPPNAPYMNGFAANYATLSSSPEDVMHYFSSAQVPVSTALAQQYAVCDAWFASAPTQTFPNRLFSLCGTSCGLVNDLPFIVNTNKCQDQESIFARLDSRLGTGQVNWKVYYPYAQQGYSYSICQLLLNYLAKSTQVVDFSEFETDIAGGALPPFSVVEPAYEEMPSLNILGSSNHPGGANVIAGERFLWQVYDALRSNPAVFNKTLLIVTYDEHGGCFDHVPPLAAPVPDQYDTDPFNRYGVRVPTILISPLISPGQIFRANTAPAPNLDHTSIIRTVFDRFLTSSDYLLARDQTAPSVADVLDLTSPDNPGSDVAQPPAPTPPAGVVSQPSHLSEMAAGIQMQRRG